MSHSRCEILERVLKICEEVYPIIKKAIYEVYMDFL